MTHNDDTPLFAHRSQRHDTDDRYKGHYILGQALAKCSRLQGARHHLRIAAEKVRLQDPAAATPVRACMMSRGLVMTSCRCS